MLVNLTPDQIIDFAETTFLRIGETTVQIARSGETPRNTRLLHKYRRKIGNRSVLIYSDYPLTQFKLSLLVKNPFIYEDEHPFRH